MKKALLVLLAAHAATQASTASRLVRLVRPFTRSLSAVSVPRTCATTNITSRLQINSCVMQAQNAIMPSITPQQSSNSHTLLAAVVAGGSIVAFSTSYADKESTQKTIELSEEALHSITEKMFNPQIHQAVFDDYQKFFGPTSYILKRYSHQDFPTHESKLRQAQIHIIQELLLEPSTHLSEYDLNMLVARLNLARYIIEFQPFNHGVKITRDGVDIKLIHSFLKQAHLTVYWDYCHLSIFINKLDAMRCKSNSPESDIINHNVSIVRNTIREYYY